MKLPGFDLKLFNSCRAVLGHIAVAEMRIFHQPPVSSSCLWCHFFVILNSLFQLTTDGGGAVCHLLLS